VKYKCYIKTKNINVQKLTSLNIVLRLTNMMPVRPQIGLSYFQADKPSKWVFDLLQWLYL
jgi:hypothetical protein